MYIGTAIINTRKSKGIKQKDLAKLIGISVTALGQIERNRTIPHKDNVDKICEVLNIPISYMILFNIPIEDIHELDRPAFQSMVSIIKNRYEKTN